MATLTPTTAGLEVSEAKFTSGPWTFGYYGCNGYCIQGGGQHIATSILYKKDGGEANARLIAAAPDYHDATFWILQAVSNNAAPINPLAALEEMALDGEHITLDAGLVLDLLKAHAKATGSAA